MTGVDELMQSLGRLELLRGPDGDPYDPGELSCFYLPHLWDEDAEPAEKRHAAWLCQHECPARQACRNRRDELKTAAEGVWAGTVIRRRRTPDRTETVVKQWADTFGLTLPAQRPDPRGAHDAMLRA